MSRNRREGKYMAKSGGKFFRAIPISHSGTHG
jgi:hypothetical protein